VVLCNARVMGEFGAVSVVSGNIRGQTNTLPLHIELLYHDYQTVGAFAAASILTVLALVTIVAKVAARAARRRARRAGRRLLGPSPLEQEKTAMKITLDHVVKTFDTFRAVRRLAGDRERRTRRTARPFRLRQDDDPAHGGGPRICRWRPILFGDQDATDIPVRDRGVGFVFQHYALFPHMTVGENIGFGMKVSKVTRSRTRSRARVDRSAAAGAAGRAGRPLPERRFPVASGSAWRWRARWRSTPKCCCSTSRSARWTPMSGVICGAGCANP
jgi:hypothetical protein